MAEEREGAEIIDLASVRRDKNFQPKIERDEYTAKQVARELEIDPKRLRKFLRSPSSPMKPAGQGGQYQIAREDLAKVCYAYQHWAKRQDRSKYRASKGDSKSPDPGD